MQSKDNKKGHNQKLSQGGHKSSSSISCTKENKEMWEYYDLKSHSEDYC